MKTKETQALIAIWASSITLTFFWVLNILKEGISGVKSFLNFYPPVGPLLGLFIASILGLFLSLVIFHSVKPTDQKKGFWALVLSAVLFLLMTFPPLFRPIAELFH